jgi:hypothetical protein
MKRINYFVTLALSLSLFLFLPMIAFANAYIIGPSGLVGYAVPETTDKLLIGAQVCKIQNCLVSGGANDWYNYSMTSSTEEGDSGQGKTLVAKPGDNLTFRGMTLLEGEDEVSLNPVYKMSFTNGQYLENFDIFGTGLADVDGDTNYFDYDSGSGDILLEDNGLSDAMGTQVGSVIAKIKEDTPNQTLIEGKFYVDNPNLFVTFNPISKAYAADEYTRSTVRVLVSNTSGSTGTLPKTGASYQNDKWDIIAPVIILAALSMIVGGEIVRRKRKQA